MKIIFEDILDDAKSVYNTLKKGENCPLDEILLDYVYGEVSETEFYEVKEHIKSCERCRVEVFKMETERTQWELALDTDPDKALADLLGSLGLKKIKTTGCKAPEIVSGISKIRDAVITWISPLWEPVWAGQAVTAADIPEQGKNFEMDQGEYINISCYWQGKEGNMQSYIRLSWNANIMTYSNLWARFINPDTNEILFESCLGTDLEGAVVFYNDELGFDPSSQRWAISIITGAA
ncbi:Uncharacterized protein dnl_26180 [Desulfonema limicola]|uniref:Zinc-finger domain-containing protein n=1 Tax=Desulfonema limicola TaxID=45656 RepID=A0A975B7Q7_9BACT|nr:hypothetical protein [Desulfonema limicola]QTA80319.1 Uncharacterized protein dnl_26180 [Desulfonema limicola]